MKYRLIVYLFMIFILSCNDNSQENYEHTRKLPHDFMFMQRAYPTGTIKTEAARLAKQWGKNGRKNRSAINWQLVGPVNIGGRITDIEIPIDQASTYFVGTASGGIFKTTNSGTNWTPIFDNVGSLSIGDIEISKSNTNNIWVGTGEVNAGGGSLAYDGSGIFNSSNGGQNWNARGLSNVGSISKVVIDPTNDNNLFVGAMGPLFKNDVNRGVFRTNNGGLSWDKVLFLSDSTGVIDLAIHPANGNIVYASTWERVRRPKYRQYGGVTSGIYRSLDGGDNWHELTNGLPTNPADKGRISIVIAPSNPNILYARYVDATGNIEGVYRSSDSGDNWVQRNSNQLFNIGYHWWFRGIFVDPTDENIIYNAGFLIQKSVDGGSNWFNSFNGAHVDQHALAFNTLVNNEVLLGNDGGLYKSNDNGSSFVKDQSLPITQFYRIFVDPQNGNKIYGGTQDNGTIRTTTAGLNDWSAIYGGDGFQPLVDEADTNIIYALSQSGNLVKSVNYGSSFNGATSGIPSSDRNNWNSPITFDPSNSQVLYYGTQRVWKTTNKAQSWTAISPDLTNGNGGGNLTFGTISTLDVSPIDSNIVIAGTDDGNVWITQNGSVSWNNISAGLPNLWTTKVLSDRYDPKWLYVTFSGYRFGNGLGHVFKSENSGLSWTDIGASLPDIPVNDIVKDQTGHLFLATDIGIMISPDDGNSWTPFDSGMPDVVVTDLHLHEPDKLLFAATYGRSAYKINISSLPYQHIHLSISNDCLILLPNPYQSFFLIQGNMTQYTIEILDINENVVETLNNQSAELLIEDNQLSTNAQFVRVKHHLNPELFIQLKLKD